MAISYSTLEALLRTHFPNATLEIQDLRGDNDHYAVKIIDTAFQGLSRVQQHQLVYKALGQTMRTELHALMLETKPPQ